VKCININLALQDGNAHSQAVFPISLSRSEPLASNYRE
jgi:hypothetical protein